MLSFWSSVFLFPRPPKRKFAMGILENTLLRNALLADDDDADMIENDAASPLPSWTEEEQTSFNVHN